jgi:type III secretory pathway component EscS
MNPTSVTHEIYTNAVATMILVGPVLLLAGLAGLLVGILQAVTQIQDQTLAQIIKLVVASIVLFTLGARLSIPLVTHSEELFRNFHLIVR